MVSWEPVDIDRDEIADEGVEWDDDLTLFDMGGGA